MLQAGCALTIAIALQAATPPGPPAGRWPDDRPFTRLVQNLARDIRALPSRTTLALLAAGGGATAAVHPFDDDLAQWAAEAGDAAYTAWGRVIGNGWTQAVGAVATYTIGRIAGRPPVTHVGSDLVRAQVLNGLLTTGLKVAVDRQRPSGASRAFPSGHTSATFASAAVLHGHFGWKAGVPAYAIASFVGWTRVRDGSHWASDVVFGATVGLIAGHTVTAGHRARDWTMVPVRTRGGAAVYLIKTR